MSTKKYISAAIFSAGIFAASLNSFAYINVNKNGSTGGDNTGGEGHISKYEGGGVNTLAADCTPAVAQTDLEVNNVRAKILAGGDMWWDIFGTTLPKYEIPKGSGIHSFFAAAIWVGGIDAGGQLRVAAMTYRQSPGGSDFYPGPMDATGSIDAATCSQYDKHFKMSLKEVLDFYGDKDKITSNISNWPGNGPNGSMAPYYDANGDNFYNPSDGDYPDYNVTGSKTYKNTLFGDETLWWVFNDVGNIHAQTKAQPIGMEIQAQAFGFKTNDEVNDMTFYRYKMINRSSITLNKTYFGQWCDSDLGVCTDDYVGCDVEAGLGYTYNGDAIDDNLPSPCSGELGYGATPPAAGFDFFQGPLADPFDGIDNDRDDTLDEAGEQIIMAKYVYFNNDNSVIGNPNTATDFYNYLTGFWRDGQPMTYGGTGYGGSTPCDFMFPGDSDPKGWGTKFQLTNKTWAEYGGEGITTPNPVNDRRFVQSAGPFTLLPGAVNTLTIGALWARASSGDNLSSIAALRAADEKAQRLFDNNFNVINGPQAPAVVVQELDKEIILMLKNEPTSNNYNEGYEEVEPSIVNPVFPSSCPQPVLASNFPVYDNKYRFEGYLIYQLKDASVSVSELHDPEKCRLVAQCDIKNGITSIVNYYSNEGKLCPNAGTAVGVSECAVEEVNGADAGILHSFRITTDAFAQGDNKLINHKQYYFKALAYAQNNYRPYKQNTSNCECDTTLKIACSIGQKKPYLLGRINNDNVYTAIPHNPTPEAGGTEMHSNYGSGVKITRIEGQGNGGRLLDLTNESVNEILASPEKRAIGITYAPGRGPIDVKVIDPLNVVKGTYEVKLNGNVTSASPSATDKANSIDTARFWVKKVGSSDASILSGKSIKYNNEQIFPQYGFSISMKQTAEPGSSAVKNQADKNGFLEATMDFSSTSQRWLSGVPDVDGPSYFNWIRSGTNTVGLYSEGSYLGQDNDKDYQRVLNGTWAPYRLCGYSNYSSNDLSKTEYAQPAWSDDIGGANLAANASLQYTSSVDIVLTSDQSKWTRCVVLEEQDEKILAHPIGTTKGAPKMSLRRQRSVDKNGMPGDSVVSLDPNDADYLAPYGMGWFPGYAINVETGERLNVAFGEDSYNEKDNGRDMVWNPTSRMIDPPSTYAYFGGRHYIYVFGHNGDDPWLNGKMAGKKRTTPRYDGGYATWQMLRAFDTIVSQAAGNLFKRTALAEIMWVNMPILNDGYNFKNPTQIPSDVKIRLRVQKPFKRAYSGTYGFSIKVKKDPKDIDPTKPWDTLNSTFSRAIDSTTTPQNNNWPMYRFNTDELETHTGVGEKAKSALEMINIVPNPYYAYSSYEGTSTVRAQLDNRVRITNLPKQAKIKIYTVNGTLVRKMDRNDEAQPFLDWDLKNHSGIPVASGLYIVHIDVPGVGEKVLKWFGVMRPLDLDSY